MSNALHTTSPVAARAVPAKRSDLGRRVATAAVALPALIALWVMTPWGVLAFAAVAIAGGVWEWTGLVGENAPGQARIAGGGLVLRAVACALGLALAGVMWWAPEALTVALVGASGALGLTALATERPSPRAGRRVGAAWSALLAVALPMATLGLMRLEGGTSGLAWVGMTLLATWGGDAGAYFVGRAWGKRKLAPKLSPNKTWEGALGGLALGAGAAVALGAVCLPDVGLGWLLAAAIPANILGQSADLLESLVKRSSGVKDSGALIPGYGGVLDKTDSLLLAAPWMYAVGVWLPALIAA